MIKILNNREINGKINIIELYNILYKKCIKEIEANDISTFIKLVEIEYYKIEILVDNSDKYEIKDICHKIEIFLINNLKKTVNLVDIMYLLRNVYDEYYYISKSGKIYANDDDKIIKRGTTKILFDKLILDNKKLIKAIKEEDNNLFFKIYRYTNKNTLKIISVIGIIFMIIKIILNIFKFNRLVLFFE